MKHKATKHEYVSAYNPRHQEAFVNALASGVSAIYELANRLKVDTTLPMVTMIMVMAREVQSHQWDE